MKIRLLEAKKKDTKIEVENPGLLEVPKGKKVYDLPVSHFKKLIDKKGRAAIIRGITNLQTWNKNDDPKIASWAKKMKKSLEGYGEKKTKNESYDTVTRYSVDYVIGPDGDKFTDYVYADSVEEAKDKINRKYRGGATILSVDGVDVPAKYKEWDDDRYNRWEVDSSRDDWDEENESLKEKLDGKPVYARLPKRALKGFKIGETVIMGKDYPEHWEITDYDDRTDEFILRNYEDEYQDEIAMKDINRREAEVDPIGHTGAYTGERNPYENESLKESSLNEEHTMVREETEELNNAIKKAIEQTQIVSKTHKDRETKTIMRKVRELLNQARNLY